jgi:hypothetical protein
MAAVRSNALLSRAGLRLRHLLVARDAGVIRVPGSTAAKITVTPAFATRDPAACLINCDFIF